ncbi:MAG TPA: 6,7-dimethyl-8-ribityllumazine synthase [Acidimicrobiales bacterium]|nr:6,7-dimethyl-8-ribityllumazine synthase [Acidimicrobiales bacterium]
MSTIYEGQLRGAGLRVAIAASRFNRVVTDGLVDGALDVLHQRGVDDDSITIAWAPGAFELPLIAQRLALSGDHDAVVCLGAVIKGGTDHYEHVAGQCAAGLTRVALDTAIPVVFGVLTTETLEQALERSGARSEGSADAAGSFDNKGAEAADTAVEMADLMRQLPKPS